MEASFMIVKKWKQSKYPLAVVHPYNKKIIQQYKNNILTHATIWINLENIMLSARSQSQTLQDVQFHWHEMLRLFKFIRRESGLVITRDLDEEKNGVALQIGTGFPLGRMKCSKLDFTDGFLALRIC